MTMYQNKIQFMGLVVFEPQRVRFLLPQTNDHTAFIAFPDGDAVATGWPTPQKLNYGNYVYVELHGGTVDLSILTGALDLHSPGFLPHLRQCCPQIGGLRVDAQLAAEVSLNNGDIGWTGDGSDACSTIVEVDSNGPLVVTVGSRTITFNKDASLVIGNSSPIPMGTSSSATKHWEHFYEIFEGTENCASIPPTGACVFASRNPSKKTPLITEEQAGAQIDCSNSQYP